MLEVLFMTDVIYVLNFYRYSQALAKVVVQITQTVITNYNWARNVSQW